MCGIPASVHCAVHPLTSHGLRALGTLSTGHRSCASSHDLMTVRLIERSWLSRPIGTLLFRFPEQRRMASLTPCFSDLHASAVQLIPPSCCPKGSLSREASNLPPPSNPACSVPTGTLTLWISQDFVLPARPFPFTMMTSL